MLWVWKQGFESLRGPGSRRESRPAAPMAGLGRDERPSGPGLWSNRPGPAAVCMVGHMAPSSQALGQKGREREREGEEGGRIRAGNNERETLSPSFVHWPAGVSFEFSKEIGAHRIVPEIEPRLQRTSWKSDFLLPDRASL